MSQTPFVITSHPHLSLGPQGFRLLLGVVIAANGFGAVMFLLMGAWPVSGFMGLDVLALYIAFRISYSQAHAYERISISQAQVTVERADAAGSVTSLTLPSYWAQVEFEGDEEAGMVALRSHGKSVPVGVFLPGFERAMFADTLRKALREARTSLPDVQS